MTSTDARSKMNGVGCGCEAQSGERQAIGVEPAIKTANLRRLRRIEGQIRGLQRMVEEDRYCADIMMQMSSVQEALRAVGRVLMPIICDTALPKPSAQVLPKKPKRCTMNCWSSFTNILGNCYPGPRFRPVACKRPDEPCSKS